MPGISDSPSGTSHLKPLACCCHTMPAHAAEEKPPELVFCVKFKHLCEGE